MNNINRNILIGALMGVALGFIRIMQFTWTIIYQVIEDDISPSRIFFHYCWCIKFRR